METFDRFPIETRMDIPEKSYLQEILETPAPFKNRIELIPEYTQIIPQKHSVIQIADKLHIREGRVVQLINDVQAGIIGQTIDEAPILEEYTLEVIEDELAWRRRMNKFDDLIPAKIIAASLECNEQWAEDIMMDLDIYPVITYTKAGATILYAKSAILEIRQVLLHFPPANGWYTAAELEGYFGKSWRWFVKTAEEYGIESQDRFTVGIYPVIKRHFPPKSINEFKKIIEALPPPAGNWLTKTQIADRLGRDRRWVEANITAYYGLSEIRLSVQSIPKRYYPPEVLDYLKEISDSEPQMLAGWDNRVGIAHLVGKSIDWVKNRIAAYDDQSRLLPDSTNQLVRYYPPEVIEIIVALAAELPPKANGWITAFEIALMLQRSYGWVTKRLQLLGVESEIRLDQRMKERVHYPPDTVDLLQLMYLIDEENAA